MSRPAPAAGPTPVASVLRRAGLLRSALPVRVPLSLVWPDAGGRGPDPLAQARDAALRSIRRRVLYRRWVVGLQLLGLAGAWVGALLPKGRVVTIVGVVLALAGALVALVDKDRLASIDATTADAIERTTGLAGEWLLIRLEIGPYSYVHVAAAGRTAAEVVDGRLGRDDPVGAAALARWTREAPDRSASDEWAGLLPGLVAARELDEHGRRAERRVVSAVDVLRVLLLVGVLVAALAIPGIGLPEAVMASLATVITLTARTVGEGPSSIGSLTAPHTAQGTVADAVGPDPGALFTPPVGDGEVLAAVLRTWVSVPRSLLRGPPAG